MFRCPDGCDGVTAYESEILKLEYAQMADPIVGRICTLQRDAKRIGNTNLGILHDDHMHFCG